MNNERDPNQTIDNYNIVSVAVKGLCSQCFFILIFFFFCCIHFLCVFFHFPSSANRMKNNEFTFECKVKIYAETLSFLLYLIFLTFFFILQSSFTPPANFGITKRNNNNIFTSAGIFFFFLLNFEKKNVWMICESFCERMERNIIFLRGISNKTSWTMWFLNIIQPSHSISIILLAKKKFFPSILPFLALKNVTSWHSVVFLYFFPPRIFLSLWRGEK